MIEINNLTKIYDKNKKTAFKALKSIDIKIDKGELCAIVGKSGAGKTTLLHILGGVDSFDEGTYLFDGEDVGKMNQKNLAKFRNKKVGIVIQDFALIEGYTVLDNVLLPMRFSKDKIKKPKERAISLLKYVDMEEYASKDVNKLSGGQKQRVAIARALMNDPDLILADEPTGALDQANTNQIIELFKKLNAEGKTVLVITHEQDVADSCNRKIVIADGEIVV